MSGLSPEVLRETMEAVAAHGGNKLAAARALGVRHTTLLYRVKQALAASVPAVAKPFERDELPDEHLPTDELLAQRSKRFRRVAEAKEARRLIPVRITCDGPIGVAHFGDPHVDDDGTNIVALQEHVKIVNRTEGLFAGNVGDYTNNWIGRLARLYGEQSTTAREAWQLAEWLITSIHWLYLVGGNHDAWSGAGDPLEWISKQANALYQMNGVRLELQFPNGRQIRVNARHDFKGHSQYNAAHGVMKAAKFGWRDHILTCGHLHVSGYGIERDPATRLISHCIRVGSYKTYDRYAEERGEPDQNIFVCPVTVIDPRYDDADPRLIQTILDPENGADYVRFLRKRKAA